MLGINTKSKLHSTILYDDMSWYYTFCMRVARLFVSFAPMEISSNQINSNIGAKERNIHARKSKIGRGQI